MAAAGLVAFLPERRGLPDTSVTNASIRARYLDWLRRGCESVELLGVDLKESRLAPIYMHAGAAELLHDMIPTLVDRAKRQGADVRLEVWPHMNHDFHFYGDLLPQSREAMQRIAQVIDEHL